MDGLGIERANIIQSYTALLNLAILDDGLQRLDRVGMVRFLAECQERDGSLVTLSNRGFRKRQAEQELKLVIY